MRVVLDPDRDRSGDHNERRLTPSDDQTTAVTLRAGEMSLHDAWVLHSSAPNRSREKRVGFAVRFVTPEAHPPTDRPPPATGEAFVSRPLTAVGSRKSEGRTSDLRRSALRSVPAVLARGEARGGCFQLVPPPDEGDAEQALEEMKHSAARHLEAMLQRLKRRD